MQRCKKMQIYKDAKMQRCKKIQRCKDAILYDRFNIVQDLNCR